MSDLDILARVASRVADAPARPKAARPDQVLQAQRAQGFSLPGILGPTRVATSFGDVPAHLVRERDQMRTKNNGYLCVQRIEEFKLEEAFLRTRPDGKPVTITKGALGRGLPARDVHLSPGQTILRPGSSWHFDQGLAGQVADRKYPYDHAAGGLSYFVFHLGQPCQIRCEGLWIELEDD